MSEDGSIAVFLVAKRDRCLVGVSVKEMSSMLVQT